MSNFIGKSFLWIWGFVTLFLFVTATDVGEFLFRIFMGLFLLLAAATLLGELGILDWGTKFKALSTEGKFLVLGAFFFFGLWLLVQYDVVNNITTNINQSSVESDNQKIAQARKDIDNVFIHKDFLLSGEIKYRVTSTRYLTFELLEHPYLEDKNIIFRLDRVNNLLFVQDKTLDIDSFKNIFTVVLKVDG